ncbi:MAG: N-acetyl sugar amidotransferase [Alphaproteobacteria bacterium]|nr:N-acetyl sugar amidotransferase [Alphaproteobacteria bacterium]
MRYCRKCVMPSTRPDLDLDDEGVCDACRMAERKLGIGKYPPIDWAKRKAEFEALIEKARGDDPLRYDCIIPVSGGKDSTWQLHVIKDIYKLRPLCLCFEPTLPTEIGRQNLENLNRMGVDLIHVKRNPIVYEKLIIEGLKRVGDNEWANHLAIWSLPYTYAVAFDIPLIVWGEGRMEFAGNFWIDDQKLREMDNDWIHDFGGLNGLRPQDLVGPETGLTLSDLKPYLFPTKERLAAVRGNMGCLGVFLGYYFFWDARKQVEAIEPLGWKRRRDRVETTYGDYEKLDCLSMNLHDYVKYCKYGYGRATDDASRDLRHGYIDREQALRLVERWDGHYPQESVAVFCDHFKMPKVEFDEICDQFTNPAIFETREGKFLRDIDGGLVMKSKWIEARRNP